MNKIEDLIFKVMTDKQFAEALLADPEVILRAEAIEPTQEILDVLASLDTEEVAAMAEQIRNPGIAM